MANTDSAKKRIRQNIKRRTRNQVWRTRARTFVKRARISMVEGSDEDASKTAVKRAIVELDKAASKGVIHKRNAARRKSRLMKQLNKMGKA